ncbi:MAG: stage 0 sporulation family protein [Clostridia bacterium]|nr:stage 0 sporulation family protein [Clostridia bacterium]
MAEIIGVRFKDVGKVYYFDPSGSKLNIGDKVIVETARGVECGSVAIENKEVDDETIVHPLKKIIRIANAADLKRLADNKNKEEKALRICARKIEELGLKMKLVDVEMTFDNKKILFYFTADGRVDFRNLVKELAFIFHTRIELRQIGVRDGAKMLGGIGICGRPFCCSSYMGEFHPVSIKMAKEQGLSLNPVKISGTCGRLMCCLKYEQAAYTELLKKIPKAGAIVMTPNGEGTVVEANPISKVLKVKMKKSPDAAPMTFKAADVKLIKDSQIKVNKKELDELKKLEEL